MKLKIDKLDFDKLVPVPVDLSKLSDILENGVVKKDVYNAKIKVFCILYFILNIKYMILLT